MAMQRGLRRGGWVSSDLAVTIAFRLSARYHKVVVYAASTPMTTRVCAILLD
jgi:hypothetical protein